MGDLDLKERRKRLREVDEDDDDCSSVTAVVRARTEFTLWEDTPDMKKRDRFISVK